MAGLTKIIIIAFPGGYMGCDGPNSILAMIGLGAGDQEYYQDLLHRGCKVHSHHPRRRFSPIELSFALQAMLDVEVLEKIGSISPDDIVHNPNIFISTIAPASSAFRECEP